MDLATAFDQYGLFIWLAIAWVLPWKGVALWKSARNGQKVWKETKKEDLKTKSLSLIKGKYLL